MEPLSNFLQIFSSEENSINYLKCAKCGNSGISINIKTARCTQKIFRYHQPICGETFFNKSKLPINEVLLLAYFWLAKSNGKQIEIYTGHSNKTITAYKKFLRKLVSDSLDFIYLQIGGKDVVVEIDETKLGKSKHHRGHPVNGAWVLGGVERTLQRRVSWWRCPIGPLKH
ncbi:hypothetical protein RF11_12867 [Thelohanellus kitauei]|uniref:ISXO2-like transposase domain-containing protein n=1 Tax=Thelohanellus kitauei TaxID=669202 RepID=A0A0C2IX35_THEKT|nr:hypothetical protein RF11_12867 [Thelohanellus kitauei]